MPARSSIPVHMPSARLEAALAAAAEASELIRRAYRGNFDVQYKADASPVTEVDVAAERCIRAVLESRFPQDGFFGEETGRSQDDAEYLWLVDPIDGTKSFVRGYPMFSVQIALMHRGELVLGVSSAPCWNGGAGELIHAEKGEGAWLDGQRLALAPAPAIEKTTLSTGNLASLARSPAWTNLGALIPRLHRIRGYGDFLHYHLLASGRIDAVLESDVNILDIAALTVILREAGAVFTDLRGAPVGLATTSVLAAAAPLHAGLLETLAY
jgi:histidinol-phosphatase